MLFSLAAGAIADNYEKRAVMLVAQTFLIVVSVLLVGCTYFGLITPWGLLIFLEPADFHLSDRLWNGPQQPEAAAGYRPRFATSTANSG